MFSNKARNYRASKVFISQSINVLKNDTCSAKKASLDEWIRLATVSWHGKSFVNFSRKLGFAATVYCIWQERNARIFADVSKASNLVFDQIECIIRDKLASATCSTSDFFHKRRNTLNL